MITNNNLDYDQASASSTIIAGATSTTAGTAATSMAMSNRNGSTSSSSNSSPTADNSNSNSNSNSNANINRNLNQNPNSNSNTNSNSYFNRFDNRIAANLAAVLTGAGARFRSSSCSNRHPAGVANPAVLRSPLATISRKTSLATPPSPASLGRRRPLQLFTHANLKWVVFKAIRVCRFLQSML